MITKIIDRLRKLDIDALLITTQSNIRYICGFACEDSALLLSSKRSAFLLTDARSSEEAKERVYKNIRVVCLKHLVGPQFKNLILKSSVKKLGIEEDNISLGLFKALKKLLKDARLVPTKDIVEDARSVKTDRELRIIRSNASLTKKILNKIVKKVVPGTEERDIAAYIEDAVRKENARLSFDPIVATGPNSAKPHAAASKRRIKKNDIVLIDFGIARKGYSTDITRTIFIGKKSSKKMKAIYGEVKTLQEMAVNSVRPGVAVSSILKKLGGYLDKKKLNKLFLHGLGHGIGLDVHEKPFLSSENRNRLKAGMVLTIEPGLYISGVGGARIEDMILVTERGREILTR